MANFRLIDNHPIVFIRIFIMKYNFVLPCLEIQLMNYRVVLDIDYRVKEDYRLFVKYSMLMQSIDPRKWKLMVEVHR